MKTLLGLLLISTQPWNVQMTELWHSQFNPRNFLSRINIDQFIERNEAHNENKIDHLDRPCIFCQGKQGPGLLLNDKSYLCKTCFEEVSRVSYPEKYELARRDYIKAREARNLARQAFIDSCYFHKVAKWAGIIAWISLLLLYIKIVYIIFPIAIFLIHKLAKNRHIWKLSHWDSSYPNPHEPHLVHFHDPTAELTSRDRLILKVFNNWPGYPPFWGYLRQVVITRDGNRCQVSGCPSRVELHIHHIQSVSSGGEHIPANLIALCSFHHALEPESGHERIWGDIKTRYFTMVRAHSRQNPTTPGYHDVRAHVRRLELTSKEDLSNLIDFYGLSCPNCSNSELQLNVNSSKQMVSTTCGNCMDSWEGVRKLSEETGPRLAEVLRVTRNGGKWHPRWDMLESRADSTFRIFKRQNAKRKTIKEKVQEEKSKPICPKCGSPMRLIKPRSGQNWKSFLGCTNYSITGCKGTLKA
jgi:hypothetical protein